MSRFVFTERRPWPWRHPFACLWLVILPAFCAVGEIDYRVARDRAAARAQEQACSQPPAAADAPAPEACVELQRAAARKRI